MDLLTAVTKTVKIKNIIITNFILQVQYAQQLFSKIREKRYPSYIEDFEQQVVMDSGLDVVRGESGENVSEKGISPELLALWDEVDKEQQDKKRQEGVQDSRSMTQFNDNLWDKQWYMVSTYPFQFDNA